MPFEVTASKNLIDSALEIALEIDRTVYDSMYLALAAHQDCVMLTADRRLFNAVKSSELSGHIAHLDES